MITLRIIAVLAVIVPGSLFGALRAQSQSASPEALQAANELLSILSRDFMGQLVSQMTDQVWPSIERAVRAKHPDVSAGTFAELRREFERIQLGSLAVVLSDAPGIYARHFTAAELREMLAFYRTPTGEKALRELPKVMSEFMAGLMPRIQELQTQTMEAFTKVLRQRGLDI
jgi:hypothetical protein